MKCVAVTETKEYFAWHFTVDNRRCVELCEWFCGMCAGCLIILILKRKVIVLFTVSVMYTLEIFLQDMYTPGLA